MVQSTILREITKDLEIALDRSEQIEPFTSRFDDFSIEDAYLVADSIHKSRVERGDAPIGRKIGFTNPEIRAVYGVLEPMWGYVYDSSVFFHSSSPKSYDLSKFTEPKIEPEIIVHFHSSPQRDRDPASILDCIDWVAHGFEIVQSHFPHWEFQAADTVADCGLHAMLIVGEPVEVQRLGPSALSDLETFAISLFCDGSERDRGRGFNVLGTPIRAVMHLIDLLVKQPFAPALNAGDLVTTGTLTSALPVKSGQSWSTTLDGIILRGISVSFEG